MGLFKKKESTYETFDGDRPSISKMSHGVGILKKAVGRLLRKIGFEFEDAPAEHYDFDVDTTHDNPYAKRLFIFHVIFLVYGFVAGILAEQYAEYWSKAFAAFASNVALAEYQKVTSTPLTILVSIIIVFFTYVCVVVIGGVIYYIAQKVMGEDITDDVLEQLQISFMYMLMLLILLGLLFFFLPFNFLIMLHT